jgi:multiple sugar transport system permease protein
VSTRRREALNGYLFAAPWLIGFSAFLAYPLLASLYYSLCDYSVLHAPVWIGAGNYVDLAHDDLFRTTLVNTGYYAIWALPLGLAVTLSLAILLNSRVRGMTIYRTLFYIPSLVPAVSLAVLWLWVFNGQHGVLNAALRPLCDFINPVAKYPLGFVNTLLTPVNALLHMAHWNGIQLSTQLAPPNWLSDTTWSKPALIVMSIWGAGNTVVIYLAGLQDVPLQLYEAADLDGASWWSKTWNVTLPMLSPVILFNMIMGIIGTLQVFTVPYIMFPDGSPARSTYFYTMYLYDKAFRDLQMGYACAMGWIMFAFILLLTLLSIKLSERHVYYEGS